MYFITRQIQKPGEHKAPGPTLACSPGQRGHSSRNLDPCCQQHCFCKSCRTLPRRCLPTKSQTQWKLPLSRKTEALLLRAKTAKRAAKQPPPLPESPIGRVGVQQKTPEEFKTSKKFKSKMVWHYNDIQPVCTSPGKLVLKILKYLCNRWQIMLPKPLIAAEWPPLA